MDSCKIIYLTSVIAYLILYFTGGSWIHPEDSISWSRILFLTAVLLLVEKYNLVPPPLTCPPFYMIYKVVAAIILANIALITVWWQTEDFLRWLTSVSIKLLGFVPVIGDMVAGADETTPTAVLQICISSYFLYWVVFPNGIFGNILKSSSNASSSNASSSNRRQSTPHRSRVNHRSSRC